MIKYDVSLQNDSCLTLKDKKKLVPSLSFYQSRSGHEIGIRQWLKK